MSARVLERLRFRDHELSSVLTGRGFNPPNSLAIARRFWQHRHVPPTTAAAARSPKLLDRVRWHLRVKHYSIRTEQVYVDWIRRFILFHRKRHPNEMGECEITEFLTHLAVNKHVAASTQNQAFAALLFLYQQVLDRKLDFIDNVQCVTRPAKLPVVFTPAEARAVLAHLKGDYRLMAELTPATRTDCARERITSAGCGSRWWESLPAVRVGTEISQRRSRTHLAIRFSRCKSCG